MNYSQDSIPPISVTELTASIKQLLEKSFAHIRVIGEISRLTRHASGHLYFTIKDHNATISAVIWRSNAVRLKTSPQEGSEFIFRGHLSVYEPRGSYQLIVQSIEETGSGQLAAEFERRKQIFTERGWFDQARKKPLPQLPNHIGIVTSPSTAAIEDVQKVLLSRPSWLRLTLSPCLVQGNSAPDSIAIAINRMACMESPPDVILLVRGGGSIEDLWCFNDEKVVRAIVDCQIPIISGIGHEIDITLTDFASDIRAATPSNAAEISCPSRDELRRRLPRLSLLNGLLAKTLSHAQETHKSQASRLQHTWRLSLDAKHLHIERLNTRATISTRDSFRRLRNVSSQILHRMEPLEPHQRMRKQRQLINKLQGSLTQYISRDIADARFQVHRMQVPFNMSISRTTTTKHRAFDHMQQRFKPKASEILGQHRLLKQERLQQLNRNAIFQFNAASEGLTRLQAKLHALDPIQVLRRGFTLATRPDGSILHSILQVNTGSNIVLQFHDGKADACITRTEKKP